MLSDSCTSLLQKLTTRVRGASALNDRGNAATRRSPNIGRLGVTRSRLEDKYGTILNRYSGKRHTDDPEHGGGSHSRKHEQRGRSYYYREGSPFVRDDKTLEPSVTRSIIKSPTSVVLSEKAYPYVSTAAAGREPRREKTPAYSRVATDRQTLLNSDAYRRYGRHKSGHAETRSRKVRPHRSGKSEQLETRSTYLRLSRPLKGDPLAFTDAIDRDQTPFADANANANANAVHLDDSLLVVGRRSDVTQNALALVAANEDAVEEDPTISDRAAKRKEIQSLILKYAAMEDTYSQLASGGGCGDGGGGQGANARPSTTDIIASKYKKNGHHHHNCKDGAPKGTVVDSGASAISEMVDAGHGAIVSCRTAAILSPPPPPPPSPLPPPPPPPPSPPPRGGWARARGSGAALSEECPLYSVVVSCCPPGSCASAHRVCVCVCVCVM